MNRKKVVCIFLILVLCVMSGCSSKQSKNTLSENSQEEETSSMDESKEVIQENVEITETKRSIKTSYKGLDENNPIVTQRYSADPGVMVYNDTVYIYTTNDIVEYDNNGNAVENSFSKVTTLNCFSSTDLVNWTDHGVIQVAGSAGAATWAANSWAPCAAYKTINGQDKFFLYFANNASGIGVLTSDSPTGPWVDPLGAPLVVRETENCSGVTWMFDPAVFVDDDGTGYLCFGGGIPGEEYANPNTVRIVTLGDDMISLADTPVPIDAPYLFEDSELNKIGDKYYYSYCTNWNASGTEYSNAAIEYMVSDSPLGPYTYVGEILKNLGNYFGVWGNNHHSIFEFQGEYYIAYHARALETAELGKSLGYRSVQIDLLTVNDGVIEELTPTMEGVSQISYVNPYEVVQAETMANQAGVKISEVGDTVLTEIEDGDWSLIKGVQFEQGLSKLTISAKATADTTIEVYAQGLEETLLTTIEVTNTNGQFVEFSGEVEGLSGVQDLYFIYGGELEVDYWIATKGVLLNLDMSQTEPTGVQTDVTDLKDAVSQVMGDSFITGVAICNNELSDELLMELVTKHFNAITFGNELKPDCMFGYSSTCTTKDTITFHDKEMVVPTMDFSRAEKMLDAIKKWNDEHPEDTIQIRGHVLVWHSQTPDWFFREDYDVTKDYVDADTMTLREEWYIKAVLEHFTGEDSEYKDMFYGWDVVNEAVSDGTGTYRNASENSTWWKIYESNEYILNAFRFANQYAPANVKLFYNDYNEFGEKKSRGIVQLLKDVKATEGTRIDGMGMQGHYQTEGTPTIDEFLTAARAYASVVDQIQVTELDFSASSSYDGTERTLEDEYTKQAYRYFQLYEAMQQLKEEGVQITGMTIWGIIDKNSWLQSSSTVGGGTDGTKKQVPLLFDDNYQVKPAYWAFVDASSFIPSAQTVELTYDVANHFERGKEISVEKGGTKVCIIPLWNEDEVTLKVHVVDEAAEDKDCITLYYDMGNGIQSIQVSRKESIVTQDGYETMIGISGNFEENQTFLFDVVVTDGTTLIAYNDTTFSQESKTQYYAQATLGQATIEESGTAGAEAKKEQLMEEQGIYLSDFDNFRLGEYLYSDGTYRANINKICLKQYVKADAGAKYQANISDSKYHILIRQLDKDKQIIDRANLADSDEFIVASNCCYLVIGIYNYSNSSATYEEYEQLYQSGFTASLDRIN